MAAGRLREGRGGGGMSIPGSEMCAAAYVNIQIQISVFVFIYQVIVYLSQRYNSLYVSIGDVEV